MPLLGKEVFIRQELPPNARPEDQVFYCKTTNEAFITYDEFFERTILCSSMVWTCTVTGRTGLTYDEALRSEQTATETLNDFQEGLKIPVLYLIDYLNESKIGSIVDMIYTFVNNRYFVTEDIEVIINTKRKSKGKVFRVIPPSHQEIIADKKQNKGQNCQSFGINSNLFKYEIIDKDKDRRIFSADRITRTKGLLTKDKIRLFLKQHIISVKRFQPMVVKESSKKEFTLESVKWCHIFAGPEPDFSDLNKDQKSIPNSTKSPNSSQMSISKNNKKSPSSNGHNSAKSTPKNSCEDKQTAKEKERQQKSDQKKLEKEQKKVFEDSMKEWNTKRDDLACDDLRPLPQPIALKCRIPTELFADSVFVMEFLHCFNDLFDLKSIFPFGITLELMEDIVFDVDIDGPFADLIKVLINSNLTLQQEEENEIQITERDDSSDEEDRRNVEDERIDNFMDTSIDKNGKYYYNWIQNHLGLQLSSLSLDAFNITEVLRLYLLSSGGGPQPRSKYRGLYHWREDPVIEFLTENEPILTKLKSNTVFDLNPKERLKIFHVLIHQLLSFFEFRDKIDDSFDEMAKLRKKIRDIQTEFNKWTKDNSLKRFPNKKDSQNDSQKKGSNDSPSQTSVPTAEQLEEYRKEKSLKEEEMSRNCSEVRTQIRRLQACYALKPIGSDRAFRKYWIFESLPGLFVQHMKPNTCYTDMPFGPCLEEPTPHESSKPHEDYDKTDSNQRSLRDDSSTTSDKENELNTMSAHKTGLDLKGDACLASGSQMSCLSDFDRCTANLNTCAVHNSTNKYQCIEWTFYYSCEHLNQLILSLNCRGFRESELMSALNRDRNVITEYMNKCQPNKLNEDIPAPESRRSQRLQEVFHSRKGKTSTSRSTVEKSIVSALREYLINLEEKIFAASLGVASEVSREEWKLSVDRDFNDRQELIKNLSKAILGLSQSMRSMCLSIPLNDDNILHNWSQSLCESTSLSQLFVHLSILEHSIKWSKSALKAYCKICRRKCDAENMLLCDQCNRGHHTYCLQPPLNSIPPDEWLCPECVPKFKPQTPKKDRNLTKTSEYTTSDDEDSDDSETESESSYNYSTSRSNSPPKDPEICGLCRLEVMSDRNLELLCAKCHHFCHLSCANIKRITRSEWFCHNCSPNDSKKRRHNIIDINISDDSYQGLEQQLSKRPKRSRYSQDFDFMDGKLIKEEEEEKLTPTTSARRRLDKGSTAYRKSHPFDYGLCDDILKKLQHHRDGWPFMCPPSHAPKYRKVVKSYVDFGQLVSRLNQCIYRSNLDFFRDVLLMLNNANFYNRIDSKEYQSSQSLGKYFERLLHKNNVDLNQCSDLMFR